MHMANLAVVDQQRAVIEHSFSGLLHKPDNDRDVIGGIAESPNYLGVFEAKRDAASEMEQPVTGKRKLRKEKKIDLSLAGLGDPFEVPLQICLYDAEPAVDLRQADG
jgi:hypothetical protein